jgi:DNA polymerase (family X)
MKNEEIAKVFSDIACLLEMKKDNIFKIQAYRKVAQTIEQLPEELNVRAQQGTLREIKGVGEAIEKKIIELLNTGKLDFYEKLKAEFPVEIITLISIPGLNPKTAKLLVEEHGIKSLSDLSIIALNGQLSRISGIDDNTSTTVKCYFLQERDKDVFQS